jgi:hypothetical protein
MSRPCLIGTLRLPAGISGTAIERLYLPLTRHSLGARFDWGSHYRSLTKGTPILLRE